MPDENPIIPRRGPSPIPVTTHRIDIESQPHAPSQGGYQQNPYPPQQLPPQPYVVIIPNSPQPAPPAPPVQHIYTTHHHHAPPRRSGRRLGHSVLGIASLALGIVACVVCWVPVLGLSAVPIGAIGAILGILGILISLMFGHSSAALPFGGLFVCVLAAGFSIASTGALVHWQKQLEQFVPKSILHPTPSSPTVSPAGSAAGSAVPPAPIVTPTPHITPAPPPVPVPPAVVSAARQLKIAETASRQKISQSDEYQSALNRLNAAKAEVMQLREQSPGSSALKEASQRVIDADNDLSGVVQKAEDSDPAVQMARRSLMSARGVTTQP